MPYQYKKFRANSERYMVSLLHEFFANVYVNWRGEIVSMGLFFVTTLSIAAVRALEIGFLLEIKTISLTLTAVLQLSSWMSYNIYSLTMQINGFTSLERVFNWIDNKEVEDKFVKPNDPNQETSKKGGSQL